MPLIRLLPSSHHLARDGKRRMEDRHAFQNSEMDLTYSSSSRMEVFSFQSPIPGGTTSGIDTINKTAQWSEKEGHGSISQHDTDDTQTYGTPMMSIRDAQVPSHLVQVKPKVEGWRYLHTSMTQHASKGHRREEELSREESAGSEPKRSIAWSKTMLKSPAKMVGTEGSIMG